MPYHKKRKTDRPPRGLTDESIMRSAVDQVLGGKAVNSVARDMGIDRMTLKRYVRKVKQNSDTACKPNYVTKQVFTITEEQHLTDYILQASKLHCGLSTKATRKLAYQYAVAIRPPKTMPGSWSKNLSAGKDWLKDFMRRHSELSLRTPEATSMARATAFNKHTVHEFFTNLREVRSRYPYQPQNIFNVDETGVTTVQRPGQVIAAKGAKQVGHRTGAERGNLVTVCCCANALGNSVPPFFIFPRVRFSERMLAGAPPGSVGVANPSGWMNGETFLQWLKHFVYHTRCGVGNKILLILDNHESHVSYECLELARSSGVTMVTLPPHCSHKLQPLDVSVYGPFKRYYNAACDDWVVDNPRPMQINDIASLVGRAYPLAFTQSNIMSGFAACGIEPLNADVFHDDDFIASSVTDRPERAAAVPATIVAVTLDQSENSSSAESSDIPTANQSTVVPIVSTSGSSDASRPTTSAAFVSHSPADAVTSTPSGLASCQSSPVTLEKIRPMPKAAARKSAGGRRRQKSRILTDTPVRAEIKANQEKARTKKSGVACKRKLTMPEKKVNKSEAGNSVRKVTVTEPIAKTVAAGSSTQSSTRTKKPKKQKTTGVYQSRSVSEHLKRPRPVSERPLQPRKPQWLGAYRQSGIAEWSFDLLYELTV